MCSGFKKRQFRFLICLFLLSIATPVFSGALDDFEEDATQDREGTRQSSGPQSRDEKRSHCDSLLGCLFGGLFRAILIGENDEERERQLDTPNRKGHSKNTILSRVDLTMTGHDVAANTQRPLLPFVRLDALTQVTLNDVMGAGLRLEAGYDAIALQVSEISYYEYNPQDGMRVSHQALLYRMLFGRELTIGFGLGNYQLIGNNSHKAVSFTFPFSLQSTSKLAWEIKPIVANFNGSSVLDLEMAINITRKSYSLNTGYRYLSSPDQSLQGPFMGLSIYY